MREVARERRKDSVPLLFLVAEPSVEVGGEFVQIEFSVRNELISILSVRCLSERES